MSWIRSRATIGVILSACIIGMLCTPVATNADQISGVALPVLTSASAHTAIPDTIVVTGQGFSPGSDVFVALYDRWGARLYETRWVLASETVSGPDGSFDPATVYEEGGVMFVSFEHMGFDAVMVRAYDQGTDSWSNLLDVDSSCSG